MNRTYRKYALVRVPTLLVVANGGNFVTGADGIVGQTAIAVRKTVIVPRGCRYEAVDHGTHVRYSGKI